MKQLAKKLATGLLPQKLWLDLRQWPIIYQHHRVAKLARRDIDRYLRGEIPTIHFTPLQLDLVGKRIIWQYWGQGLDEDTLPEVVRRCFASVDKYKSDYLVIRLSDETIAEYLELPDFVYKKLMQNGFTHTFFSDLLRLALLSTYGGVWLDATILLSSPLPDEYANLPFFAYQRSDQETDQTYWRSCYVYYYGWHRAFRVRLLNSILFAHPNQRLIVDLCSLIVNYWREHDSIIDYFFFQIYFNEMVRNNWRDDNCPIVNDCIPHILQTKINGGAYHHLSYQEAIQQCGIHKMSYFSTDEARAEFQRVINIIGL